ncbi:MAG: hypothetical protein K9N49_03335 [Candidatus Marinimicrobia bacterium]|nr:hypothetical protein [Candidatus Neomarinimicrobiota bacterium]
MHTWRFFTTGGVSQPELRTADDLRHLPELDQKLWMALALPTQGTAIDPRTAVLLDTDGDGRIRPPEILAATRWLTDVLDNPALIFDGGDRLPLAAIKDEALRAGAQRILANLGKPAATEISLADVADQERIFSATLFNGDGIAPPEAADDPGLRAAMIEIMGCVGSAPDRSGRPGLNRDLTDQFFTESTAWAAWAARAEQEPELLPLPADAMAAAQAACTAVQAKLDDYFMRCRLARFDDLATGALNAATADYDQLADDLLSAESAAIAALPLAGISADHPLPLERGLNPAWADRMAAFAAQAVQPLLGPRAELTETEWLALRQRLAPYAAWQAARPESPVARLGLDRLRALLAGNTRQAIDDLIARDLALAAENDQLTRLEKLLRYQRDFAEVLTNSVNFADFYSHTWAVFQAGTLYLDARACHLCLYVTDPAKHATLATRSGAFLAYCAITRPGQPPQHIVAVFTNGDSDHLIVGRNGVFYDRDGRDWDATLTQVVSHPISVRQAFWSPYKKLARFVEDQIAKRAQAAEADSTAKLEGLASEAAAAPTGTPPAPKKIDLGTIALIGTAIGGISALIGGLLSALFGLGFWLPLGLLGLILLVSGPSMILAALKLRQRNLGPILDANGWAINARARINPRFGAALTEMARLPADARRLLGDPFAARRSRWFLYALLAAVLLLAALRWTGRLDRCLPPNWQFYPPAIEAAPANNP